MGDGGSTERGTTERGTTERGTTERGTTERGTTEVGPPVSDAVTLIRRPQSGVVAARHAG